MTDLTNKCVTTRKLHQCAWCGESIEAGSKAQYRSYIFESEFTTSYMHPECEEAMGNSDFYDDEGFAPGEFKRGKTVEESKDGGNDE
jgi:hypothetical protein